MTTPIPTTEPTELRCGITWQWRREDLGADYPAPTWTLKYWFKRAGAAGAYFSITAAADGSAFAVTHLAATSQSFEPGTWTWVAVVTSGADAHEVGRGEARLLPRYDTTAALDDRSHARKVLDAVEAVLEGRATKDQEEYTINNRSLRRTPLEELLALRDAYRAEVLAEQQAADIASGKGGSGGRILVRL